MRAGRALAIVSMVVAVAACGQSDDTAAPGDVTVSEAKALDEAAEMIEAHRPPPPAVVPSAPLPPNAPAPGASRDAR
jgi:nitrous oxide reductase accessory protein NosL